MTVTPLAHIERGRGRVGNCRPWPISRPASVGRPRPTAA